MSRQSAELLASKGAYVDSGLDRRILLDQVMDESH